jgi:limonene-1,2-epoxide hydrolase
VLNFFKAWEARDLEAIANAVTEDCRYTNIGFPEITGRAAIREAVKGFVAGSKEVRWIVHNIAETDNGVVLAERTDEFDMAAAKISAPVTGVFELRDGKISAWRDYFDTRAMGG